MLLQLGADIVYAGLTATGSDSVGLIDMGRIDWVSLGVGSVLLFLLVVARMSELVAQAEAVAILDRMRLATPLGETVSIGVVQWDGEQTPEVLIGGADDALYRAKEQGRNRVVATPPRSRWGGDRSPSSIGAG